MILSCWDLDGCLVDNDHRRTEPDFPINGEALLKDLPIAHALERLQRQRNKDYQVAVLTARVESLRAVTQRWMQKHGLDWVQWLLMRPDQIAYEKSTAFKQQVFNILLGIRTWKKVLAYDDQERYLEAYHAIRPDTEIYLCNRSGCERITVQRRSQHVAGRS